MKLYLVVLIPVLGACTKEKTVYQTVYEASATPAAGESSLLASKSNLPACTEARSGSLAFVKDEAIFYTCDGSKWLAISIKGEKGDAGQVGETGATGAKGAPGAAGKDGLKIAEIWRYHTNNLSTSINIAEGPGFIGIGTIELVKFTDSSVFVSTAGAMIGTDSGAVETYSENFSHTFILPASSAAQEYMAKFDSFANERIRYTVSTSGVSPSFSATVDADGDFANNPNNVFPLVKQ